MKKKSRSIESLSAQITELCKTDNYSVKDVVRSVIRRLKLDDVVKFEPDDQERKRIDDETGSRHGNIGTRSALCLPTLLM